MLGSRPGGAANHLLLGRVVVAGLLLLLVACGREGVTSDARATHSDDPTTGPSLTELLRATTSFDFEPAETPAELLQRADVAVVGSVRSISRVLLQNDGEFTGGVIITLKVEESWKAPLDKPDTIDVFLRWPKNLTIDAFERDLPVGSRIAFFGYRVDLPVLDREQGSPALYDPDPQGLMLLTATGALVNVWGEAELAGEQWGDVTSLTKLSDVLGVSK